MVAILGLFGSFVRKLLVLCLLVLALVVVVYYRYAASRLPADPAVVRSVGLARPTPSLTGGGLPFTFEAYEKRVHQHNWLLAPRGFGLVSRRFEWSHSEQRWIEDRDFAQRQHGQVAARRRHAEGSVAELIDRLEAADPIVREVAAKELLVRTGETFGYRYDAPEAERREAIERWRAWWGEPANKARYGAERAGQVVDEVLDVLRRATGGEDTGARQAGGEQ